MTNEQLAVFVLSIRDQLQQAVSSIHSMEKVEEIINSLGSYNHILRKNQ